jgi:hypothetical protein
MTSDLKALDIAVNQLGMPGSHLVKTEPGLDHREFGEHSHTFLFGG